MGRNDQEQVHKRRGTRPDKNIREMVSPTRRPIHTLLRIVDRRGKHDRTLRCALSLRRGEELSQRLEPSNGTKIVLYMTPPLSI